MSNADVSPEEFDHAAANIIKYCDAAIENSRLAEVSEDLLAAVLTALLRFFATRAQNDLPANLAIGNNRISATDSVICSTAILESAGIEVFELAAWQAMTNLGSSKRRRSHELHQGAGA
jgi:hypothetical protein